MKDFSVLVNVVMKYMFLWSVIPVLMQTEGECAQSRVTDVTDSDGLADVR